MKKFSKLLVILISLSLLINVTIATSSPMNPSLTPIHNYTDPHQDLQDYSSDYSSALECIEDQGRYELACLKNSDDTLTSSIRNCLSDGICTSDVYGEFSNWPSGITNKADYCENDLFIGEFDSKMSIGHEDFIPEQYTYFEYNTDDDSVNSDDDFHKQKAEHLLESTLLYEFGNGPQEFLSFNPMMLYAFARESSFSDAPYCKSTQKVHTTLGERYIVLFETNPTSLSDNRGPPGQGNSYFSTHLLDGGNPNSNLIYSDDFHLIDNHLLMIYDGYRLQVASMGGALTYDSFPSTFSDPSSYISSLSFEEKCRLLDQSAFRRSTGGIQGWNENQQTFRNGFNSDVNPPITTLYYHDYDCPSSVCFSDEYSSVDFEYINPAASDLLMPYDWVGTNYLSETCYENPITPNIEIYATDFPEFEFEGVYPAGVELTFDASGSTPAELFSEDISLSNPTVKWDPMTGAPNFLYSETYSKSILESESPYQQDARFQLLDTENWMYDYSFNVTVEDMIYANIQTSLSSDQVEPGQDFTIQLSGMTFDGTDLANFFFDPGQREVPNGIFIVDTDGNFQCKETELDVTCLGTNAIYEGGLKIRGNACGCPVSEGGSGTLYSGQKTANLEDASFQYEFNFYYPSKTSCGADRICDLSLNVSDVNGLTSVKEIQLYLPGVQSCSGVYSNSIPGTNSSLFVGLINDGEQSCQCKEGYNRELDAELTALSGGNAYVCERDITIINDTINDTWYGSPQTGQENPVSNNNAGGNSNANNNGLSKTGDKRDTSGLTIFLVLMLLILAAIFGFEFYKKKKTGAFFNPFKKSPTTDSPFSESSSQSPVEKFISDAKSAGEDPETIKQNLKKSGWPDDEINKYLK